MKNLFFMLLVAAIFGGCVPSATSTAKTNKTADTSGGSSDVVVQKVDKDDVRDIIREEKMLAPYDASESELSFTAVGEGIAPLNTVSSAQALALAKRAAITDGYRQLASKLYGVKVNGKDTVKDAMLRSSTITAQVNGLIKNASIIDENFNQGLYRVNLELKIDADKWKELFAY
ncbi:flagellar assembly lipoprotein FlgP [Campylobacter upsaliensis]|uniref:Lipoprotein required for motility n=3 Tax=Campylobacter TaxID=194 RepID=A0A381EH66_CAMUP|nr:MULTISPECIES: flagellar assembly lipoprotein FlgP [Campylobacter]EAB5281372.1 lipoprotein required for motility [Campylobacter upsaliensis]EAH4719539.1 lipoprotein required for motility [Campylobacter upsaliensis]EAH5199002.1 lipoprotein required for motility [Campylobacter upsaliensis]EAH5216851.1 lipoprotein required for motility [Campylobacter upsaliensis]EAH5546117.1 lipoprotein required for motility [Campylobacter upsaliensis]